MNALPTWDEFEALIGDLNVNSYERDADTRKRRARDGVRKVFYEMDRRARENETLRQMLVDLGIENASLAVELEAEKKRTAERKPEPTRELRDPAQVVNAHLEESE